MAVKAGDLIHVGGAGVLLHRLQTGGPGSLNIPRETIRELGNYLLVGVSRDRPDLTFNAESYDVSTEFESMLLGTDFGADAAGTEYDLAAALPLDVASQMKLGKRAASPYDVAASIGIPFLGLESASYRFGTDEFATQSFTLRTDGYYIGASSTYIQQEAGSGSAGQTIQLTNDPIPYEGDVVNGTRYALSVVVLETGKRLSFGTGFTEAADTPAPGNVTLTITDAVDVANTISIVYHSLTVASYPQLSHEVASANRPAAVRGQDIEIRVGGVAITDRWSGVQNVQLDWRVQLERDTEMGNPQIVAQDFEQPEATGSVTIRPNDPVELVDRIKQVAGVAGDEVVGALQVAQLPMDVIIHSPTDGSVLKTFHIPDTEFTLPGITGRVQQKMDVTLEFDSPTGQMLIYKNARP